MDLLLAMGILSCMIGLIFTRIQLQLNRKQNTSTTLARLTKCDYQQNVKIHRRGRYHPKIVKHHVTYEYTYTVGNKTYRKKGVAFCSPRDLPQMPSVIYLIRFPWHAEVPKLTTDISMYLAIFGTAYGVLFLVIRLILSLVF